MGYPMTYQRVVNRNQILKGGDYAQAPLIVFHAPTIMPDYIDDPNVNKRAFEAAREELERANSMIRMVNGDLRRLERDAVDENATCVRIAQRTGIDEETVAAVLKEFFSW